MKDHYVVVEALFDHLQQELNSGYEEGYRIVSHKMIGHRHVVIMELVVSTTVQ